MFPSLLSSHVVKYHVFVTTFQYIHTVHAQAKRTETHVPSKLLRQEQGYKDDKVPNQRHANTHASTVVACECKNYACPDQ